MCVCTVICVCAWCVCVYDVCGLQVADEADGEQAARVIQGVAREEERARHPTQHCPLQGLRVDC